MTTHVEHDPADVVRRLRRVEDELEIRNVLAAWQRCSDGATGSFGRTGDGAAGGPVARYWHPDGEWVGVGLSDLFAGRDRRRMLSDDDGPPRTAWMPDMIHFLTNVEVEVADDRTARARCYSWEAATVVLDGDRVSVWIAGDYDIDLVRYEDRWVLRTMRFTEVLSAPFTSTGWHDGTRVPYGPGQVVPPSAGPSPAPDTPTDTEEFR